MAEESKIKIFISIDGAPEVPWESLTTAAQEDAGHRLAERMAGAIRDYWGAHPAAYNDYVENRR